MRNLFKDKLRTGVDEKNSAYVLFPSSVEYLLPRYAKYVKMKPVFKEGIVTIETSHPDTELNRLVDAYIARTELPTYEDGKPFLVLADDLGYTEMFAAFLLLLRYMLKKSYEFTDEELSEILTLDAGQFGKLLQTINKHIREN